MRGFPEASLKFEKEVEEEEEEEVEGARRIALPARPPIRH